MKYFKESGQEGFEPSFTYFYAKTVFETVAINHSAITPSSNLPPTLGRHGGASLSTLPQKGHQRYPTGRESALPQYPERAECLPFCPQGLRHSPSPFPKEWQGGHPRRRVVGTTNGTYGKGGYKKVPYFLVLISIFLEKKLL